MKHTIYVGTYTTLFPATGDRSSSLYIYTMDSEVGKLQFVKAIDGGENPSFLALAPAGDRLYAVNEYMDGAASAFAVNPEDGVLQFINRQPVQGDVPCHLGFDSSGRWLMVACYISGSLTLLPVKADGALGDAAQIIQHQGSGPARQQDKAHVHCAVVAPGGKFILVADLGMDRIWVYRLDTSTGEMDVVGPGLHARPGAGPRHLAFHPNARIIYCSNELDSTVMACNWNPENGELSGFQTLTTLPESYADDNAVADIHITPDGKYLFVSNRGDNSLAAYRVDESSGMLSQVGIYPCGGKWPRNFAIDPSGKFILVANQHSENIAVLRIADDGSLTLTGEEISVPAPVCVLFGGVVD